MKDYEKYMHYYIEYGILLSDASNVHQMWSLEEPPSKIKLYKRKIIDNSIFLKARRVGKSYYGDWYKYYQDIMRSGNNKKQKLWQIIR